MNTSLNKFKLVIVILIISGLFVPQRISIQLSVVKWEKLLSIILNSNRISNTSNLDVNEDGTIDIKDLCVLYSKFSEGDKGPEKKQIRILEAVVNKGLNTHLYNKQKFEKLPHINSNFSFTSNVKPIILCINLENGEKNNHTDKYKISRGSVGIFALRC